MTTTTYYSSSSEILDTILVKKNDDGGRRQTNERWITPGPRLNDDASIEFMELQSLQSYGVCKYNESLNWPPRHFESYSLLQKSMCMKIGESRIS